MEQRDLINVGIYIVDPIEYSKKIKIKQVDVIKMDRTQGFIPDTILKRYEITEQIVGEISGCNITDSYLMSTKKLPVLTIRTVYVKSLMMYQLFKLYIYFNITSDIKTQKQLLSSPIDGYYSVELAIDDERTVLNNDCGVYPTKQKFLNKQIQFTKSKDMIMLMENMKNDIEDNLKTEMTNNYSSFKVPDTYINTNGHRVNTHFKIN